MSEGKYEGYRLNTSGSQGIGATATKPQVAPGDIVAIHATDWALYTGQTDTKHDYTILWGWLYGVVVAHIKDGIVIAPQVFDGDEYRYAVAIPLVCIKEIVKLGAA